MAIDERQLDEGASPPETADPSTRAGRNRGQRVRFAAALALVIGCAGCSSIQFIGADGRGGDTLKTCASSDDCKEVVSVSLNSFSSCAFIFRYSKITVPGGVVVEWTIPAPMASIVSFAPPAADSTSGIYIAQDKTDVGARPFINPQAGKNDNGSLYFRWTANPDRTVSHADLSYSANVRILNTVNTPISCTSDPTIANN